ncbi:molecular chaperone [Serratia sp. DD3]|uniref:fimbrial biogenesis chaperone n=1 Tax=Serratia sp. DD3 TaxID=1410619 RepID=UPI0003C50EF4|nr:molecular chaperone [Serratia sp. DD3]KEY59674.1 putative fimbrial chaperone protein ElfD [Serratia sp. DD3]
MNSVEKAQYKKNTQMGSVFVEKLLIKRARGNMQIHSYGLMRHAALMLTIMLWSASSVAGISLTATRLIVDESRGGSSIGVRSDDNATKPFLIRAQVFRDIEGQDAQVPFVISPALFRLEPGSQHQFRVMKQGGALPQDKESLFYLRVAALPATSGPSQTALPTPEGALTVATGNIIKLFYRPNGLSVTQKAAMGQLQFTAVGNQLNVSNPTPYYITLSSLKVNGKSVNIRTTREQNMIAPYGNQRYGNAPTTGSVQWSAINDHGGREVFDGSIQ